MRDLVILRHPLYDEGDSEGGIPGSLRDVEGYRKISRDIKELTGDRSCYMVSSPAERAVAGAEVLASDLDVVAPIEKLIYLWDADDVPKVWEDRELGREETYGPHNFFDKDAAREKLERIVSERADRADTIILVSHLYLTMGFATHYVNKNFGKSQEFGFNYGEGVLLDLETRDGKLLPLKA